MKPVLLSLIAALLFMAGPATTQEKTYPPTPGMTDCAPLEACLALIGARQPAGDQGYWPREVDADVALLSTRFGEEAKQALLEKLTGPHGGWRNYAAAAISIWPDLGPQDLPVLARSLELKAGGWSARGVARIGGREAIEILVAHPHDMSQTSFALITLAPESLPYLLPLLAGDEMSEGRRMAMTVIRDSKAEALAVAPEWVALALDARQPTERRIAALRGLAAIGDRARDQGVALRPLRRDPSAAVRNESRLTLAALRDSSVTRDIAEACRPTGALLTGYAHHIPCLYDLAAQYRDPDVVAPALIPFLDSPDGAEVASATTILGFIAWEPARSKLETLLVSKDWRVAYAAARSLGWMGGEASLPALDRAASDYWLPAVRTIAADGATAIRGGKRLPPPASFERNDGVPGLRWLLSVDRDVLEDGGGCSSGDHWRGRSIRWSSQAMVLDWPDGRFVGTNRGEWGGALDWDPTRGGKVTLLEDNVVGIIEGDEGPIVAFGLAHLGSSDGFVAEVTRGGPKGWTLTEIVRLPSAPEDIGLVSRGVYAAKTWDGVVVFDRHGPLGCGGDE